MPLRQEILLFTCTIFLVNVCFAKPRRENRMSVPRRSVEPVIAPEEPYCEDVSCDNNQSAYCGSNGRTYDTDCQTRVAFCTDKTLTFTHGKCPELDVCKRQREHALLLIQNSDTAFMSVCNQDGSFAPLQCGMGKCWCVDHLGTFLDTKKNKRHKKRKAPQRKIPNCGRRPKHTSRCESDIDKISFAYKVSGLLEMDYRYRSLKSYKSRVSTAAIDAVRWKMAPFIGDRIDNFMFYREFRLMFKPYRHGVSRRCTKMFPKYCDADGDMKVTEREFLLCLRIISEEPTLSPSNSIESITNEIAEPVSQSIIDNFTRLSDKPPAIEPTTSERITCREYRRGIFQVQNRNVHLPDCEGPNGEFYQPIQCHDETGYCYCVNRDDGKPVPNTSTTSNGKPDCDVPTTRAIPGCKHPFKDRFLRSVIDILLNEWSQLGRFEVRPEDELDLTDAERASRWYFDRTDVDNDGVFSRPENKTFKKLLANKKVKSRKCLRRFVQHCDSNSDKKMTVGEFVSCLEVNIAKPARRPSLMPAIIIGQLKTTDDPEGY